MNSWIYDLGLDMGIASTFSYSSKVKIYDSIQQMWSKGAALYTHPWNFDVPKMIALEQFPLTSWNFMGVKNGLPPIRSDFFFNPDSYTREN